MKKRFTEGELNHCEVMLRDIKESAKLAQVAAKAMVRSPRPPRRYQNSSSLSKTLCLADACQCPSFVVVLLARDQVRGSDRGKKPRFLPGYMTCSNVMPLRSFCMHRVSG